jgi:Uma2 family endonuclease
MCSAMTEAMTEVMTEATPELMEPPINAPSAEATYADWEATSPVWQPPSPPTDLIFDDGVPLESNNHRVLMNLLIRLLKHTWRDRTNFFTSGNMFIYYSSQQVRNRDYRGPDFFAVLNVEPNFDRPGWVVWEENGRYPDIIIELLSDSTAKIDRTVKKDLYEQVFRTKDYFIFDPLKPDIFQGWTLDQNQCYQELVPNEHGWLWSETLEMWLGTWQGTFEGGTTRWLRFYDRQGNLLPMPEEEAQQQAEQAQQQAEQAQQQAEQERQRAEQAEQRLAELQQRLLERGLDLDSL